MSCPQMFCIKLLKALFNFARSHMNRLHEYSGQQYALTQRTTVHTIRTYIYTGLCIGSQLCFASKTGADTAITCDSTPRRRHYISPRVPEHTLLGLARRVAVYSIILMPTIQLIMRLINYACKWVEIIRGQACLGRFGPTFTWPSFPLPPQPNPIVA